MPVIVDLIMKAAFLSLGERKSVAQTWKKIARACAKRADHMTMPFSCFCFCVLLKAFIYFYFIYYRNLLFSVILLKRTDDIFIEGINMCFLIQVFNDNFIYV